MRAVKVLPKGQITLPKEVREELGINVGDTLVLEKEGQKVLLRKGKTLLEYKGALPDLGMSVEEMREKAVEEAVRKRG